MLSLTLALTVAACGTFRSDPPPQRTEYPQYVPPPAEPRVEQPDLWADQTPDLTPRHMAGRTPIRIGLLLPLGAEAEGVRHVAKSLRDAAELALFEIGNPDLLLIVEDTKGTPLGAERAATAAMDQGAEILLGPLFADSVRSIGPQARQRGIPVVAFSSDRQTAGNGVYLLSFQVEEEVKRVVEFAARNEISTFAAIVPENAYGDRVDVSLMQNVNRYGGIIQHLVNYTPYTDDFRDTVKSIAEYDLRKKALDDQIAELEALQSGSEEDEAALRALQRLKESQTWGPVSYQAVLLPEGGTKLRTLAPMLPYFDIDNRVVRFLGTGLWDDPNLWTEPSLQGGWFAAPPPAMRASFNDLFTGAYDYKPHRLASLAYDAVTLAAALSAEEKDSRYTPARLENQGGFAGIDGLFRFMPSGGTERGLAILQISRGKVEVIGEAPGVFAPEPADPFTDDPYGRQPSWQDPYTRPQTDPYSQPDPFSSSTQNQGFGRGAGL